MHKRGIKEIQTKKTGLGSEGGSLAEYLFQDILEWVEEYPQFKKLINWEKINHE